MTDTLTPEKREEIRKRAEAAIASDHAAGFRTLVGVDIPALLSALDAAIERAEKAEAELKHARNAVGSFIEKTGGDVAAAIDLISYRVSIRETELTALKARVEELEGALKEIDRMTYGTDGDLRKMIRSRIHAALKEKTNAQG